MERENRSNGNQEESKEGRKEETLRAFHQSKTGGREKRPLSFCGASFDCLISCQREGVFRWRGRGSGKRRSCNRNLAWHQTLRRQSFARPLPLLFCTPAVGCRCG